MTVRGDTTSQTEMLGNLIDNAIRYTQSGGNVTVRVEHAESGTAQHVEDIGMGIDPQHRERVFGRFYRIHGSGTLFSNRFRGQGMWPRRKCSAWRQRCSGQAEIHLRAHVR